MRYRTLTNTAAIGKVPVTGRVPYIFVAARTAHESIRAHGDGFYHRTIWRNFEQALLQLGSLEIHAVSKALRRRYVPNRELKRAFTRVIEV